MAYDVELADRIRDVLETTDELDVPTEVVEKQMFGGWGSWWAVTWPWPPAPAAT